MQPSKKGAADDATLGHTGGYGQRQETSLMLESVARALQKTET